MNFKNFRKITCTSTSPLLYLIDVEKRKRNKRENNE